MAAKLMFIHGIQNVTEDTVVLIYFDNHEQNIIWLWSVVVGGYLPAMLPAFVNDLTQRRKQILHLKSLFKEPLILTSDSMVHEFLNIDGLNIITVENLVSTLPNVVDCVSRANFGHRKVPEDAAILMFTSGSTGNAKAVVLRNSQIKAAVAGKISHHGTRKSDVFLGWVALDHDASLCQIHLHALALGARQVFVDETDVSNSPVYFLNLIHNLRISVTFAPNFYLTALSNLLDKMQPYTIATLGSRRNVVSPGFGMTETCAGSMHNLCCPSYDIKMGFEFTSVGPCVPDMAARVAADDGHVIEIPNVPGSLQVKGELVFKEYFNDPLATSASFTNDGWFITGDSALIDGSGYLHLCGRMKDLIIVNGVNYYPHELERAIDSAKLPGLIPTYTVVFSHRPNGASTEKVVVVFSPAYGHTSAGSFAASFDAISKITARLFGILHLDQEIPLMSMLMDPTIHGIAAAIQQMRQPKQYNPVVKLRSSGEKSPLWFVHPGVGEVLVFLNLAKYINDRPLYALRARGFEAGEEFFTDLPEICTTYFRHIKETQPWAPYAIAGYSFGAMIAFEIAKLLGDEIKFLGSFNLPPRIKDRMRQLDWAEAGINLSYFLDLISKEHALELSPKLHELSYDDALDHIMSCATQSRLVELSLTRNKLRTWITLAHKMKEAALEYEPSGSVASIDVFHAIPLKLVAANPTDWIENKLSKWADFSRELPRMHQVDGAHYTMMSPEHPNACWSIVTVGKGEVRWFMFVTSL
ncbi:conserved hypothetical protein [Histoplasma capsulatum var. duboisii H88]|uniref:Uncharacterized protein n=1 Tax=Ajellomyces capsulatus (strain H88) TaxID=544711 RepID=F0UBK8_AJEC8|nr:conserved hypothetical protein [Histoplasma capsulatum var. duboisii H88]